MTAPPAMDEKAIQAELSNYQPALGDLVFELGANWGELTALSIVGDPPDVSVWGPAKRASDPPIMRTLGSLRTPVPLLVARRHPALVQLNQRFDYLSPLLRDAIARGPLSLARLRKVLTAAGATTAEADLAIKCWVAFGLSSAQRRGKGVTIVPSQMLVRAENDKRFAFSISAELRDVHQRLGYLVSHRPTIGSHRETLLRSVLRKYVPARFHVATGFIVGSAFEREGRKQIDVLIYDRSNYAPRFVQDDLVVVDVEAVRGVIEVKSDLSASVLREALEHIEAATRNECLDRPFFKGIFGFSTSQTADNAADVLREFYRSTTNGDWPRSRSPGQFYQCVDALAVMDAFCLACLPSRKGAAEIQIVESGGDYDPSTAAFLYSACSFLDVTPRAKQIASRVFNTDAIGTRDGGLLQEDGWQPQTFARGMPHQPDDTWAFVQAIETWRAGERRHPVRE